MKGSLARILIYAGGKPQGWTAQFLGSSSQLTGIRTEGQQA